MTTCKKTKNSQKMRIKGCGIRGQLLLGFTVFAFMILIIVWVFQVLLLDKFYEFTKYSELRSVLDTIEYSINNEDIDEICSDLASQYDVCLALYTVTDGVIDECIIDKEVSPTCVIHYADKEVLNNYYIEALETGNVILLMTNAHNPVRMMSTDFVKTVFLK